MKNGKGMTESKTGVLNGKMLKKYVLIRTKYSMGTAVIVSKVKVYYD